VPPPRPRAHHSGPGSRTAVPACTPRYHGSNTWGEVAEWMPSRRRPPPGGLALGRPEGEQTHGSPPGGGPAFRHQLSTGARELLRVGHQRGRARHVELPSGGGAGAPWLCIGRTAAAADRGPRAGCQSRGIRTGPDVVVISSRDASAPPAEMFERSTLMSAGPAASVPRSTSRWPADDRPRLPQLWRGEGVRTPGAA